MDFPAVNQHNYDLGTDCATLLTYDLSPNNEALGELSTALMDVEAITKAAGEVMSIYTYYPNQ